MANFIVRSNFGKGHIFGQGKESFFIKTVFIFTNSAKTNKRKDKSKKEIKLPSMLVSLLWIELTSYHRNCCLKGWKLNEINAPHVTNEESHNLNLRITNSKIYLKWSEQCCLSTTQKVKGRLYMKALHAMHKHWRANIEEVLSKQAVLITMQNFARLLLSQCHQLGKYTHTIKSRTFT